VNPGGCAALLGSDCQPAFQKVHGRRDTLDPIQGERLLVIATLRLTSLDRRDGVGCTLFDLVWVIVRQASPQTHLLIFMRREASQGGHAGH
jgi:hypothetical protein